MCPPLHIHVCARGMCRMGQHYWRQGWAEEAAPARAGSSEVGSPSCVAIGGLVLGMTWTQRLLSCAALPGQVFFQQVHR